MIVGTAGHIDHGKTTLVRALTGIDTDSLPEEKRRAITIELGHAHMAAPGGQRIAFVDVPGHEKLVRTMVAGASGIAYALLLIAADDGVMPQTVEHLGILALLGVRRGAAIITKTDRADAAALERCQTQARTLLASAGLADWDVLCVSAQRGDGLDALRALLFAQAQIPAPEQSAHAGFRMGLDQVFTRDGIGTVVAGSIAAGRVRVGDALCLAQAPATHWRVRSLHAHGQSVDAAVAGQRCAVDLAGLERSAVARGQTLCDPAIAQQSLRVDVWLRLAPGAAAPLRSGTLVHLHAGTQDCMASVALLGQPALAPGADGCAQLLLRQPISVWQGERMVLRDAAASRTLAGALVLDPDAPARYRQTPERIAYLQTQHEPCPARRLQAAVAHAPFGLQRTQWLRDAGLLDWPLDPHTLPGIAATGKSGDWLIASAQLAQTERALLAALAAFHTRQPQDAGADPQRARRLAAPRMPAALWQPLLARLLQGGAIALRQGFVCLPEHGAQLRAADKLVAERALPLLLQGRFDPPWIRDLAAQTGLAQEPLRQALARLASAGEAQQIVKDLYYHPQAVAQLAALARELAARNGAVTAAGFRDATGLGRKRAIQILEFFDRTGLLRRVGDRHLLRPGVHWPGAGPPPAAQSNESINQAMIAA